jgi:hypothetical protein
MSDQPPTQHPPPELAAILINSVTEYAIFTLDTGGHITSWNPGAQRLKGYTSEEVLGKHFSLFYTEEDRSKGKPQSMLDRTSAEGHVQDEGWRLRKDGSKFWAWVVLQAMLDAHGQLAGFAKITRDLTDRKQAEERRLRVAQLEEAARVRTEFLNFISHEMRSPLSAFHLQVQLLRTDAQAFTAPRAQKIVERLDRSYRRLAEMVETVLEQSRIQAGRAQPRLQQVDLVKSAIDVVEELRPEAEGKGLKLSVTSQISEGSLETDPTFLRLILVNLLGNAIKFTRSGSIDVALLIGGKEFRVKVRDDGPGIPAQDHQRIFEPFVRLESFEHTHTDGFGLGLANAKRLSEALLGRIELESKPGFGSTFTLVLPAEPQRNT